MPDVRARGYTPPPVGEIDFVSFTIPFLCIICVIIVPKKHTVTSRQITHVTSHHIPRTTYYYTCYSFLVRYFLVHCMVNTYMLSLFSASLNLVRPSQAFDDAICSFRRLAYKGFPDGYSTGGCVCACVCPLTQKLRAYEVVLVHAIQLPGRPRPKWEISFGLWEHSCSINIQR